MELQTHDTQKNLTHNTSHLTLFQTDYLAYGEELTEPLQDNNGTILNKIGFTGHEHDYGTGFINMQARLQNPGTGKFLSVDPGLDYDVMDPMSWNLYNYCGSNPIRYTDPTGMVVESKKIGNKYYIKLRIAIVNKSHRKIPKAKLNKILKKIAKKIENTYSGEAVDKNTGKTIKWETEVSINEGSANPQKDHIFVIEDVKNGNDSVLGQADFGGMTMMLNSSLLDEEDDSLENTAAHELGHTLNLDHVFLTPNTSNNVMWVGKKSGKVETTLTQIKTIHRACSKNRVLVNRRNYHTMQKDMAMKGLVFHFNNYLK